jgi:hypothetical protein
MDTAACPLAPRRSSERARATIYGILATVVKQHGWLNTQRILQELCKPAPSESPRKAVHPSSSQAPRRSPISPSACQGDTSPSRDRLNAKPPPARCTPTGCGSINRSSSSLNTSKRSSSPCSGNLHSVYDLSPYLAPANDSPDLWDVVFSESQTTSNPHKPSQTSGHRNVTADLSHLPNSLRHERSWHHPPDLEGQPVAEHVACAALHTPAAAEFDCDVLDSIAEACTPRDNRRAALACMSLTTAGMACGDVSIAHSPSCLGEDGREQGGHAQMDGGGGLLATRIPCLRGTAFGCEAAESCTLESTTDHVRHLESCYKGYAESDAYLSRACQGPACSASSTAAAETGACGHGAYAMSGSATRPGQWQHYGVKMETRDVGSSEHAGECMACAGGRRLHGPVTLNDESGTAALPHCTAAARGGGARSTVAIGESAVCCSCSCMGGMNLLSSGDSEDDSLTSITSEGDWEEDSSATACASPGPAAEAGTSSGRAAVSSHAWHSSATKGLDPVLGSASGYSGGQAASTPIMRLRLALEGYNNGAPDISVNHLARLQVQAQEYAADLPQPSLRFGRASVSQSTAESVVHLQEGSNNQNRCPHDGLGISQGSLTDGELVVEKEGRARGGTPTGPVGMLLLLEDNVARCAQYARDQARGHFGVTAQQADILVWPVLACIVKSVQLCVCCPRVHWNKGAERACASFHSCSNVLPPFRG